MKRRLTDAQLKRLKPEPGATREKKITDGGGLYAAVTPAGSVKWRYKYRKPGSGSETIITLGTYPQTGLAEARNLHMEARALVQEGIDPVIHRDLEKARKSDQGATFKAAAERWYAKKTARGGSRDYHKEIWSRLHRFVFPKIGDRPIEAVTISEIRGILDFIHDVNGTLETAHRVRSFISQIYNNEIASGRLPLGHNPAAHLAGHLPPRKHKSYAAIVEPIEIGELLLKTDRYKGNVTTVLALRLLPLLFQRPGREFRLMEISEIDLESNLWTIPKHRTKKKRAEHKVPLSSQAAELIRTLIAINESRGPYVLSGRKPGTPISAGTLNQALHRLGVDTKTEHTSHGWRATARTRLAETGRWNREILEVAINHQLSRELDPLDGAYDRAEYVEARREVMQAWADMLDQYRELARAHQKEN